MCWVGFGYGLADKVVGKAINCSECGGERCKVLIAMPGRGLYSICKCCGAVEWEWAPGDGNEHLEYLGEKYSASIEAIKGALDLD
ncbi:MAG: hypothetical protein QXG25_02740 [Nitrososphaerota archaeon]